MSNNETLPPVIVRSYGNEPVPLVAHRLDIEQKRVLVGNPAAKHPIKPSRRGRIRLRGRSVCTFV
jgi:hypothetical protein